MKSTVERFIEARFGNEARVFYEFPVLTQGTALDNRAFIVDTKEGKKLIMTDHGDPFVAEEKHLDERLMVYNQVTTATVIAKEVLRGEWNP